MKTDVRIHALLAFIGTFLVSISSIAQENLAQEGMTTGVRNYTSFTQRQTAHLSEWAKHNDPSYANHPEYGTLPKDAPCQECVEDLSKRTIDERYFIDLEDPSKFYQQKAVGDLHMQVNGYWVTIDHSLQPVSNGIYESRYAVEQSGINTSAHKAYIKTVHGVVQFNDWTAFTVTGNTTFNLGEMSWDNYTVGDDGIYITEAFPGIDAEMIIFRGSIKTNFIIKSNELGVFDQLVFRDVFTADGDLSMNFVDHNGSTGTGELAVRSGDQNILSIGEAILFAKDGPKDLVRSGEYSLNGNVMDVRVPFSWINENIGAYQLVVDPVVTGTATLAQASITGSRYNGTCNFTNSCDYNLTVASPANATLTNVAWTFTYTANGTTCWLQDGGIRIASGGCVSPATAGYYWFCNAIGGGTCSGNNQTIFGDMAACMPAPSCTPQNVTFTMRFYRSCWGATGCNNACIGAGSPWVMTITGQTLDYTNVANPITLSATTVCSGGAITASTTGQYGVPGYTYNWSFSPTGTPSVGTGASASITFPTTGTVTLYSFVTDACGNTVTSSRTVTVTPGPTVTVNSPTICSGQSATLTATGATTYTWTPTATLSSGTGATVTATPATTTTYTVSGTTSGCTSTATAVVTVTSNPVIVVNSPTICAGQSATLNAMGATSYTWTPAATLSSGTGATVTATPATTTTYTITGATGTCTGTTTATVTVNANPTVTVNSATICDGQSATLTATGATSYTWTPAATLSSGTGSTVTATPTTTTTYTVTGTTGTCTGTATSTVTVNPNPTVLVNNPTMCEGQSVSLNAGGGANSFTWTPAGTLSSSTGSSVTASPTTTTTYTVTGTITATGCSNTATGTVTVYPIPTITVNDATICAGQSATLIPIGAGGYTWTPAGTLSSSVGSPVIATPTTTTTYTIVGTLAGCTATVTSTVTVIPNPTVTVNSATICAGQSATLNATGATSYTWTPTATLSSGTGATVTATPATTTTYTVTGTTGTCSSTATSTVTVNPNPTVTVNSPSVCAGQSVTLNATGATSYTWTPAATLSSGTGSTVTATPATTTTYTVTGTTGTCTGTATSTVTVNPNPTVTATSATICAGQSATLSAGGAGSYTWTPAATLSSATGSTVTATPPTTTTYTVTGTLGTCSATATSTVTVTPNPVVTVNSATICAGQSATLNATGATSYTWTPAATLSSGTGATVTATPATTTTYTITGTTGTCTGTATSTVTVNPIPTVTASNNGPICSGTTLQLTAAGQAGALYTWVGPNVFSSGTQNPQIASVSAANEGTYTVTISMNGCSSTSSTTFTLLPGISSAINANGPYCQNDGIVTLSSLNPGGTWSGTGIVNAATGTFDPALATIGSNAITYTIPGGCGGPTTANIIVNSVPVPTFTASATTGCSPLAVQLNSTTTGAAGLLWNFGNGSGGLQATENVVYTAGGCYDISLTATDNNGCVGTTMQNDLVCVIPDPIAQFQPNNAVQSTIDPTFQFFNMSTNATTYAWEFGDNSISTQTSPSHTYSAEPGSYLVQLVAYNSAGCTDTAWVSVLVEEDQIFFIPNTFTPNGDESNNTFAPVFTSGVDESNFSLMIFNRWGETLFETKDPAIGWDGTYNGRVVPAGTYVWVLRFKDPEDDKKFEYRGNINVFK